MGPIAGVHSTAPVYPTVGPQGPAPSTPGATPAPLVAGAIPVRIITETGINARALHPKPCTLVGFQFFSLSQTASYVSLYDLARTPNPAFDEPVIGPLPIDPFGELHSLGDMNLVFTTGIALTITGGGRINDTTPVSAGAINGYVGIL